MHLLKYLSLLLISSLLFSCSSLEDRTWSDAIPENISFVVVPAEDVTLSSALESSHTPFLDDITSSAVQMLSHLDSTATSPLNVEGIMLYPGGNNELESIWVTHTTPEFIEALKENFYEDFAQNEYSFHDKIIFKLNLEGQELFASQLNDVVLFSESSLGIEDAVRAYQAIMPRVDLAKDSLKPGHILMNTPALDKWIQQLSLVQYHPLLENVLQGTQPALLAFNQQGELHNQEFQLSGTVPLNENDLSNLVASVSDENRPIALDPYISSNAAAFALFRLQPRLAPPTSIPDTSTLDSIFIQDQRRYSEIAETLDHEFALVMYAESGFLSTGEHLFLRKVKDAQKLQQHLETLEEEELIEARDDTYLIRSAILSELIGSSLNHFQDFYLNLTDDVVVISRRKGLAELVESDYERRRTVYYEQQFREIKNNFPSEVSSLFMANPEFQSFIDPFLMPDNHVTAITSRFNHLTMATQVSDDDSELSFQLQTLQSEEQTTPYEEQWLFSTGSGLSGEPVMADIGGSSREEVIFATESGELYALAADGTIVMQTNTGSDEPVGSPVVYDWYGTNQNVILLAAGNRIYGWDDNGELLPKFPFELEEAATSPVVVDDINQNGIPDALIATADRNLHALNGRGEDLNGWPVTTNAEVNSPPTVANFQGTRSIIAFSENAVHVWNAAGSPQGDFPKFLDASLNGSPVVYEDHILANAADGFLYSVGTDRLFPDSVNVLENKSDTSEVEAIYASNSALIGSPSIQELTVRGEENTHSEPMILTLSSDGSVFLFNTEGELRFNQNMGQPADQEFSPFITDINQDGQPDIIALADFGRLYGWQVINGERFYSDAVPTNGMKYPIITDINNDGYNELIAQTSEGLRCWTIYGRVAQASL